MDDALTWPATQGEGWDAFSAGEVARRLLDPLSSMAIGLLHRAEEAEKGRDQAIAMAEAAAKFAAADDAERAALKARAEKVERERPLTARDMADVFGCVWNSAIGAAHRGQQGMEFATILAETFAAMASRLQEIAAGENSAHAEATAAIDKAEG